MDKVEALANCWVRTLSQLMDIKVSLNALSKSVCCEEWADGQSSNIEIIPFAALLYKETTKSDWESQVRCG
jgi:hypothetical protein